MDLEFWHKNKLFSQLNNTRTEATDDIFSYTRRSGEMTAKLSRKKYC